jgi:hypothetical protein
MSSSRDGGGSVRRHISPAQVFHRDTKDFRSCRNALVLLSLAYTIG